eukprot:482125_1
MAEKKEVKKSEEKYEETSEGQYDLQLVCLICRCGRASLENNDNLYVCNHNECSAYIYCSKCGTFYHDNHHKFDNRNVICINNLVADVAKKEEGLKKLKKFLGIERYNKLSEISSVGCMIAHNATTVSFLGLEMVQFFSDVAHTSIMRTTHVIGANFIGAAIVSGIEIAIHSKAWYEGKISLKEFGKISFKTLARNGTIAVAVLGGAKCGAAIGTTVGSVVPGAGNAIGFISGVLLGIIVGVCAGMGLEELLDKVWPTELTDKEQQEKRLADIHNALIAFNFSKEDIENEKIFNQKEVDKRYKKRALEVHPDRRAGDVRQFHVLSSQYGILKGLLEDQKGKKIVAKNFEKKMKEKKKHRKRTRL